ERHRERLPHSVTNSSDVEEKYHSGRVTSGTGHGHLTRPQPQKESIRDGMAAIDRIENRRFGIERDVAADAERKLVCIPDIAHTSDSVRANSKRRMNLSNTQLCAIL